MRDKNEFLATSPFDLYSLTLFELVAEKASFTAAGVAAGLTQSAISRRVDGMEKKLGVRLFERTTRSVRLTPAGEDLYARSRPLLTSTGDILRSFQESQGLRPPILRVGVSRSIGLSYLPGYFFAFRRKFPKVLLRVVQQTSREILRDTEEGTLDVGLVAAPKTVPRSLIVPHRFRDDFVLILPPSATASREKGPLDLASAQALTKGREWLLIDSRGSTGADLRDWLAEKNWPVVAAMELDSFDMILNLVSLGVGVSLVPSRVLALYRQRREVLRFSLLDGFTRALAVVVHKSRRSTSPLAEFVDHILF